jgi:site-specific recombinase XerD
LDETKEILQNLSVFFTGFLFVNKWGRHYSQDYLNNAWNKAVNDAGYKYIPLKNASRHSLGTKLAVEGYGEDIISKVLGHSNTRTTQHYTRYASDSFKPFFKRRNMKKAEAGPIEALKRK